MNNIYFENQLVIHHIGGRAGSRSFPVMSAFEADIVNVLFDADESCVAQVKDFWKTQPSKTIVLPYCLGASEGVSKLHINYDPYTSSMYPFNKRYEKFYYPYPVHKKWQGYDYVIGDTFRAVRELQVPVTTLDSVALQRREVPCPDFLSIDTQGSELDILIGSSRLLDTTILAIHAEVELHPLYEGQPLFGDICQLLSKFDFDLVDIQLFSNLHPIRGKQGFRGKGYVAHGEALFLKRPERVTNPLQLNKLAFIASTFGQFECAQQCFESTDFVSNPSEANTTRRKQPIYLDFVSRLAKAVVMLPLRSAPLFSDKFTFAQSEERFQIQSSRWSVIKSNYPSILPTAIAIVRFTRFLVLQLYQLRITAIIRLHRCFSYSGSAVESLFLEFGMKDQYLLAMKNRILDRVVLPR